MQADNAPLTLAQFIHEQSVPELLQTCKDDLNWNATVHNAVVLQMGGLNTALLYYSYTWCSNLFTYLSGVSESDLDGNTPLEIVKALWGKIVSITERQLADKFPPEEVGEALFAFAKIKDVSGMFERIQKYFERIRSTFEC